MNRAETDKFKEARESIQDAIDATDIAITKQACELRETIKEIEALLGVSGWRNPF